jgi:hypothetical protein
MEIIVSLRQTSVNGKISWHKKGRADSSALP